MTMPEFERAVLPADISRPRRLVNRVIGAWRDGGISRLVAEARQMALWRLNLWVLDRLLDSSEASEIAQTMRLGSLTIDSENRSQGVFYTPTPILVARCIHALVPGPREAWNFVDIGAGRGRVVAQAARHPYRRVIGVEFAAELVADAKAHLQRLDRSAMQAGSVEILHADATCFEIPDGPNAYFLFNPFGAEVLAKFANHVAEHATNHGRPARVLYYHPAFADIFAADSRFRPVALPTRTRMLLGLLSPYKLKIFDVQ